MQKKITTREKMVSIFRSRIIDLKEFDKTEDEIFYIKSERERSIARISKATLDLNKRLIAAYDNLNIGKLN